MIRIAIIVSVFLWAVILGAVSAFADTKKVIPLSLISVDNSYMRPNVRIRAVRQAITYYRKYGAIISRKNVNRRADPFRDIREEGGSLLSFQMEFYSWFKTLHAQRLLSKTVATHVLAPPFAVNAIRYMGGFAFLNGFFSYSTVQEYNTAGKYRFRHSVVGIVHELGHSIFGCTHETGVNVMHVSAFAEQELIEGTGKLLPLGPECQKKVKRFKL